MDSWLQNIDPQLLEQYEPLVEQMGGGFMMQDEMQVDEEHMAFEPTNDPYNESTHMGTALDMMISGLPASEADQTTFIPHSSNHPSPVTPQRSSTRIYQNTFLSPPPSLRANANVFQPGSSWHDDNPYASLASNAYEDHLRHTPHGPNRRVGCLTPDSATTSQIAAARQLQSPTRVASTRSRPLIAASTSTPAYNMGGVSSNARQLGDIVGWNKEAYNVPAATNVDRLAPHPSDQSGRRSRATSVASTIGQGDFVCDGVPGKRCGKRFMTRSALSHHARCHKSDRHFCSICEAGFYYMKDLKRHMKTHAPRDVHLVCNNRACKYHLVPFGRRDHLERHMLNCRHSQQG